MQEIINIDLSPYIQTLYDNINFENVLKFVIIYFFIIRISLIIWVIKDITNRTSSILFQMICILIITFWTPLSVFIYLLIRPGRTLYEKYQEEIEDNLDIMQDMIEDKHKVVWNTLHCFSCEHPILPDFKFCPTCKIELKKNCSNCDKVIYRNWELCPYCWEEHQPSTEKKDIKKPKQVIKTDKKSNEKPLNRDDVLEIINELQKTEKNKNAD